MAGSQMTIADVEDAYQTGRAAFESWRMEWYQKFYAPYGKRAMRALFSSLSDEQKAELERLFPEEYKATMEMLEGGV